MTLVMAIACGVAAANIYLNCKSHIHGFATIK
jgi:hypothetical protein